MARAMKDSGVAWIGEIPDDWQCRPIKNSFSVYSGATPKSEVTEFWDGEIAWVTPADFKTQDRIVSTGKRNLTEIGYNSCGATIVPAGSIIFSKRAPIGTVAVAGANLCTNQGCLSCVPLRTANTWYFYYAMSVFTEQFNLYGTGTTFKEISYNDFVNFMMPLPNIDEQSRIAAFLDHRCAEIDRVMEQTRTTIEEYKRLKQSIITEAVTHGIRPERKMKDSGVEWIGEVPEEWKVTKLKYFATIRSGLTLGKVYPSGTELFEYPYLRVANVQGGHVKFEDIATIMVTKEESMKYRLHVGELLMTEGGDRDKLGRGTVWHGEIDPCLHQNHVFALNTDTHRLLAEYIEYLSISFVGRDYFDVTANQSVHLASTNSTTILNFTIPYPSMNEQKEIVSYLNHRCGEIDRLIDAKQQLLSQLEAYKKSVIYEYVTGKREVPT